MIPLITLCGLLIATYKYVVYDKSSPGYLIVLGRSLYHRISRYMAGKTTQDVGSSRNA